MNKIDYAAMTDRELKQYFLSHRDDDEAFQAYMDRRHTRPRKVLIKAGELENLPFDQQINLVDQRMRSHLGNLDR
jgi:hypothetical protein